MNLREFFDKLASSSSLKELHVELIAKERRALIVKIGRQREPRTFIAFDSGEFIVAQGSYTNLLKSGGDCIFLIDPKTRVAIYNLRGGLFPHLNPKLGAKVAKVPQEFVNALESIKTKDGDLIGIHPSGSPIFFKSSSFY